MSKRSIPTAPWYNGVYPDGDYDVVIQGIERHQYGHKGDYYFRIILKLVQEEAHLVTNIYIKEDYQAALKRIWHFCQACGESDIDFCKRLDEFRGKHIRVTLFRMSPKKSGAANPFSDVKRFVRASKPLTEEQWAAYRKVTSPQVKISAVENKPENKKGFIDLFAV